ncbi:MAG: hypothetical protein H0T42_32150 [Deltaproteobacteria bacterium]|nr:hypothetical protein [Deltaproteobacteria bacterium]
MKRNERDPGQPIHPVLLGAPLALFVATIALQLALLQTGNTFYFRAAMIANITGVVIAMIAVIPNATGVKHAVANSLTVALFAASSVLLLRSYSTGDLYVHLPLALGMIGIVAMASAATLGYALPDVLRSTRSSRALARRNLGAPLTTEL